MGWILKWTMRGHQEGNTDKGTNDFYWGVWNPAVRIRVSPPATYKLVLLKGRKAEEEKEVEKLMDLTHSWPLLGVTIEYSEHL